MGRDRECCTTIIVFYRYGGWGAWQVVLRARAWLTPVDSAILAGSTRHELDTAFQEGRAGRGFVRAAALLIGTRIWYMSEACAEGTRIRCSKTLEHVDAAPSNGDKQARPQACRIAGSKQNQCSVEPHEFSSRDMVRRAWSVYAEDCQWAVQLLSSIFQSLSLFTSASLPILLPRRERL